MRNRFAFVAAACFLRALAAVAGQPQMTVDPLFLSFPTQEVGTQSENHYVTIQNAPGGSTLSYTVVETGPAAADFLVSCDGGGVGCLSGQINPGASVTLGVAFLPSWAGLREATLTVSGNDTANPTDDVILNGVGWQSIFADGFETGDAGFWLCTGC